MPRFYFDHHDGRWDRDEVGAECTDVEHAIKEAKRTLPAMALDEIPRDGDHRTMTVLVTDEDGRTVYTATLAYTGLVLSR